LATATRKTVAVFAGGRGVNFGPIVGQYLLNALPIKIMAKNANEF
jgi:ABC-type branched-subunit amino acid transport system permease subunit